MFLNRETILILLSKLDEESRYSDIVFVYETYFNKIKEKEHKKTEQYNKTHKEKRDSTKTKTNRHIRAT